MTLSLTIDPESRLNLPFFEEDKLKKFLKTTEEFHSHAVTVFPEVNLNNISTQKAFEVCEVMQKFLLIIVKNMRTQMPFDDVILSKIGCIDPQHSKIEDWVKLANRFPKVIGPENIHKFYDEASNWNIDKPRLIEIKNYCNRESLTFNASKFYMNSTLFSNYPLITKLARALISLPLSGASIERSFSQLQLIKNEKRTRLEDDTLESLLLCKINQIDFSNDNTQIQIYEFHTQAGNRKRKYDSITPIGFGKESEINKVEDMIVEDTDSEKKIVSLGHKHEKNEDEEEIVHQQKKLKADSADSTDKLQSNKTIKLEI